MGGISVNEETTLDLSEVFDILRKRKKLIILITAICVIAAGIFSFFIIPPTYEATVSVIIGKSPDISSDSKVDYQDVMMYEQVTKTYSKIALSNTVAEKAVQKLNNGMTSDDFIKCVKATPETDTQIITLTADSKSASDAMNMVNALADCFIEESQRIYPTGSAQIMDKAKLPKFPIKPRKKLNVAIAFVLGIMASVGLSFLLEYMDNTIKTESDIEKIVDLPVIGVIPKHTEEL